MVNFSPNGGIRKIIFADGPNDGIRIAILAKAGVLDLYLNIQIYSTKIYLPSISSLFSLHPR